MILYFVLLVNFGHACRNVPKERAVDDSDRVESGPAQQRVEESKNAAVGGESTLEILQACKRVDSLVFGNDFNH
jgi:hypothetical protein